VIHPLFMVLLGAVCLLLTPWAEAARKGSTYPYQSCFEIASHLHDVPLDVLLAMAATESAWNPDARSHANAHGIMQIQWPGTARHLGITRVSELYNPCLNIELGARYLRELLDRNGGDLPRALAAYNYGPSRIEGLKVLPSGASRYVDLVGGHRDRIRTTAAEGIRRAEQAHDAVMRFDHVARARRYAETLNARIGSAEFSWSEMDDGFGVTMQVKPEGLSFHDVTLLETLGWPGLTGKTP
jgi:soluble lytic murein transglycosylase-like protein